MSIFHFLGDGQSNSDFGRYTKNTRECGTRVFSDSKLIYGFFGAAGEPAGLFSAVGLLTRPGLFKTAITSFVKSTLSREYIRTGTPLRLFPDLSKTRSRLLDFTLSSTTSLISLTIPSRIRRACS